MKKIILSILFALITLASFAQHQFNRWVTTSGTDTYTAAVTVPTYSAYTNSQVYIKFGNTNTGASTLNINSIGAVAIRYYDGDSWEPLTASYINTSTVYKVAHNGTFFELESFGGSGGSTIPSSVEKISSFTLSTADAEKTIFLNSASAIQITVPDLDAEVRDYWWNFVVVGSGGGDFDPVAETVTNTAGDYNFIAQDGFMHIYFDAADNIWHLANGTAAGGSGDLTVGTSAIASGTSTRVLYNNAGVLGEYVISGSGNIAMTTSPVFTTPNIGSATGSVSGNAGTATALQTGRTINGTNFDGTGNITVTAAAGTLTGVTLNSGVTASSLTSFGSSPTIVTPSITTGLTIGGAAASGTILRGNGTNFVASTLTIPNSATAGDLLYASGSNAIGNLALGTSFQILRVNSGATAPEYASPSGGAAFTATDTYIDVTQTGAASTGAVNAHGFSAKFVGVSAIADGDVVVGDNTDAFAAINILNTTRTAYWHLKAGTATASTAPLKFTSGTVNTTPEVGAVEFDGTNYFGSLAGTRYTLAKTLTATATLNFDLTAVNYQDLTITVTGAADGDVVSIGVPNGAVVADITFFGWVSATNTVSIRCSRVGGGGAADPASGTFRASVIKY